LKIFRQQANTIQNQEYATYVTRGQSQVENIKGLLLLLLLLLAAVKSKTIQATKLPLWHKLCKIKLTLFCRYELIQAVNVQ
jgi:hypothetical protein